LLLFLATTSPTARFQSQGDATIHIIYYYTGVDFAGPLHIETHGLSKKGKVWICQFTCCVVRALHLEIVPDLTANSFLTCFKHFTARREIPSKVVSTMERPLRLQLSAYIYSLIILNYNATLQILELNGH